MSDQTSDSVNRLPPALPPRPPCRVGQHRIGAACVWTVLLIFFGTLCYLGTLAFSRNSGQAQPNPGLGGHVFFGILLVGCMIAAVIGVISRRHREHPHHH